ncbi:unnamed protein product [Kuraishia capsulata CBS 1993]|uniref:Amidase domain-containing protein n=1 Tax=Kuraishia capsulata CBS 1993 TaxID=1382522 RepID=W6MKI7_9ASCO|nr:uncharacterized protein KUCA_T00001194001 [Kuraishia capsulata CBS 1993]CDK25227.1 unnamed protein product [Kuraishia capsulata CBS 1993]
MFDFAIERAKELDGHFAKTGKVMGPLHGLPISLKDSFNVPGFDSTIGYVSFIDNNKTITQFSDFPQSLWDMGAVFHVKTNVPQTLMTTESTNHVWGTVLNPNNISLGAGGSSGGEGALARMKGSIAGIGTDIGGSIRVPSVCNGTYGFKPSSGRLPYGGQTNQNENDITKFGVACSAGPMASNFEAIELIVERVLRNKPYDYDPEIKVVDYNDAFLEWDDSKKLNIGFILEDPQIPVYPNIKRSLTEAAALLSKAGHNVIPLTSHPSIYDGWFNANQLFYYDNCWDTWKNIVMGGEPPLTLLSHFTIPPFSWRTLKKWTRRRVELTSEWRQLFVEKKLDIILCPGSPSSAAPHNCFGRAPYLTNWNNCDFPACIIPFGKPLDSDDKFVDIDTTSPQTNIKLIPTKIPFDPIKFKGGIGHVQIVARAYEDEKLVACGKIVNQVLHPRG